MRNTWWQSYCWCLRDYGCFNNSLGNVEITVRERPLNLKGRGGGYGFFPKKYSDSQCCWKKYSDFGGGKKE